MAQQRRGGAGVGREPGLVDDLRAHAGIDQACGALAAAFGAPTLRHLPADQYAVILFNCILRTVELIQDKRTQAYVNVFTRCPTVGLSAYGESYLRHMSQTATMLVLRRKGSSRPALGFCSV